jgi:signal transduction histidine kinase
MARITDKGPGIPPHLRRKIFGRFVRLGNELERKAPGTGLGLYIVRTLVRRLGGQVHLADRRGLPGTVFEVDLPAASPQEPPRSSTKLPETSTPVLP